jgi:hypothetical protein
MTMSDSTDDDFDPELDDRLLAPVEDARPQASARGALVVGARIVAGTVGLVVAGVVVAAAGLLPLPTVTGTSPATVITPIAAQQQRVCPGPLLRLGNDQGEAATDASSVGYPTVRFASSVGDVDESPLASTDNTAGVPPTLLTLAPQGTATPPLVNGGQSQFVNSGDLVGFAAAECAEAVGDSWLVGGATTTGRTSILTLSNPSRVAASVTLTIYGENGPVSGAGTDGIVVPPGGQRILSLAGFAPDLASPVVRVQSRGGQVVASLQEVVVRVLDPGGVDIVGAGPGPSTSVTIPGVVIANSAAVAPLVSQEGFSDLRTAIRLLVPGTQNAKVTLTVLPEDTAAKPTRVQLSVTAGSATEVPLDSFPDGEYSLSISSDQPLVAGARVSTVAESGATDFSWIAAGTPLRERALVSVPDGPSPVLHLVNTTASDVTVSLRARGKTTSVSVPAGRSVATPVQKSTDYTLTGFDSLFASVSYLGEGQLASFGITPMAPGSEPITVYP